MRMDYRDSLSPRLIFSLLTLRIASSALYRLLTLLALTLLALLKKRKKRKKRKEAGGRSVRSVSATTESRDRPNMLLEIIVIFK